MILPVDDIGRINEWRSTYFFTSAGTKSIIDHSEDSLEGAEEALSVDLFRCIGCVRDTGFDVDAPLCTDADQAKIKSCQDEKQSAWNELLARTNILRETQGRLAMTQITPYGCAEDEMHCSLRKVREDEDHVQVSPGSQGYDNVVFHEPPDNDDILPYVQIMDGYPSRARSFIFKTTIFMLKNRLIGLAMSGQAVETLDEPFDKIVRQMNNARDANGQPREEGRYIPKTCTDAGDCRFEWEENNVQSKSHGSASLRNDDPTIPPADESDGAFNAWKATLDVDLTNPTLERRVLSPFLQDWARSLGKRQQTAAWEYHHCDGAESNTSSDSQCKIQAQTEFENNIKRFNNLFRLYNEIKVVHQEIFACDNAAVCGNSGFEGMELEYNQHHLGYEGLATKIRRLPNVGEDLTPWLTEEYRGVMHMPWMYRDFWMYVLANRDDSIAYNYGKCLTTSDSNCESEYRSQFDQNVQTFRILYEDYAKYRENLPGDHKLPSLPANFSLYACTSGTPCQRGRDTGNDGDIFSDYRSYNKVGTKFGARRWENLT